MKSHTWENYLASFPTETYVNHPVIFSGFRPNGHGLIANSFYCPELKGKAQLFCGWDTESVIAQDEARPEGLYAVPDMAELLAQKVRPCAYCVPILPAALAFRICTLIVIRGT